MYIQIACAHAYTPVCEAGASHDTRNAMAMCMYACMHVCMYVYIYIYIYIYIYVAVAQDHADSSSAGGSGGKGAEAVPSGRRSVLAAPTAHLGVCGARGGAPEGARHHAACGVGRAAGARHLRYHMYSVCVCVCVCVCVRACACAYACACACACVS